MVLILIRKDGIMAPRQDLKERFLKKVSEPTQTQCWEWQSTIHRDGYGKIWYEGRQVQAHRISYLIFRGEIPAGLWVLHRCDNRKCVNPEHLYVGTPQQNVMDKVQRCEWWGRMKIPFETVQEARRLVELGWTQQRTADHLGIKQVQVSRYARQAQRSSK